MVLRTTTLTGHADGIPSPVSDRGALVVSIALPRLVRLLRDLGPCVHMSVEGVAVIHVGGSMQVWLRQLGTPRRSTLKGLLATRRPIRACAGFTQAPSGSPDGLTSGGLPVAEIVG
jgi:hypothetical protein